MDEAAVVERPVVPAGTRVQIVWTVLPAGDRPPEIPADTAGLPYRARTRGLLTRAARIGEEAEVRTRAGRRISGTVEVVEPGDHHSFGVPPAELIRAQQAIEALLEEL